MIAPIILAVLAVVFDELEQHSKEGKWKAKLSSLRDPNHWYEQFRINWLNTPTAYKKKHRNYLTKTALVWTQDAEHLFQFLKRWCFCLVTIPIIGWWCIALRLGMSAVSWLMNERFLK